ncbi:DNA polymerase delta small subunit-like [Durio zibethinus]|uniref:DNA polymerase delta small subunit-like n=1 Tax=Durio zibethinus TaxID=66656 RepID=A0A6P5Z6T3_DURZI|nr:DNA polymerase delta small subunit-like [Durio zibethinus]
MMRTLLYFLVPNWKSHLPVLGLEEGKECIIVGILYKHMKLKPCILDEYSKERSVTLLVKPHNFKHQDDYWVLEDESGRVKLHGIMLSPSVYVTVSLLHCMERKPVQETSLLKMFWKLAYHLRLSRRSNQDLILSVIGIPS